MTEMQAQSSPEARMSSRRRRWPWVMASICLFIVIVNAVTFPRFKRSSYYRLWLGDAGERVSAVQALADGAPARSIPRLLPVLDDPAPEVRRAVIAALEDLRAKGVANRVVERLTDEDAGVREKAARFCGAFGDHDCVAHLAGAVSDSQATVRAEVIRALAALDAKKESSRVAACLDDEDESVRTAAVKALGRIGSLEDAAKLVPMLDEEDLVDPSDVVQALTKITGVNRGLDPSAWQAYLTEQSTEKQE